MQKDSIVVSIWDRALWTIRRSPKSWPLSLAFLRGCGLPETFLEYIPSLLSNPIQFYSCFISYSTTDQEFADRLRRPADQGGSMLVRPRGFENWRPLSTAH